VRTFLSNLAALAAGTVSLLLTLGLVLGLQRGIDLNLFSLMWWGVIPLGAFITGLLAASGYYYAATKLNVKPSRSVAGGMLIVAALFQVVFYYTQYAMTVTEDGQAIASLVSFPRFVGYTLSHAKYGLTIYGYQLGGADGGLEVGFMGYIVALLQFLALAAGGLGVYAILASKPYCEGCTKFLRSHSKAHKSFHGDAETFTALHVHGDPSSEYFEQVRALPSGETAALELELYACPLCAREALVERPMLVSNGKLSYQGESFRTSWVPQGTSVAAAVMELQSPG
jgi:hypothetical protein